MPESGRLRSCWRVSDARELLPLREDFDVDRLPLRPLLDELPLLFELELDLLLEPREFRCVATLSPR